MFSWIIVLKINSEHFFFRELNNANIIPSYIIAYLPFPIISILLLYAICIIFEVLLSFLNVSYLPLGLLLCYSLGAF